MVIAINEYSDVPIYIQIRNQIVLGISDGRLEPGEQLPTVRGLAEEMGVNSMTVNKAYQLLKQEGYIYTDRRNGAKVRERMEFSGELPREAKEMLQQVISEAKVRGMAKEKFYQLCEVFFDGKNVE
uniref:GntR family transcriptional regulator n=1 Tax=Agathobacter sp. TaxID=2021311 RepID=UPI00405777AB